MDPKLFYDPVPALQQILDTVQDQLRSNFFSEEAFLKAQHSYGQQKYLLTKLNI